MLKTIVAGGAGFIGSHLCRRLLKEGYEVICLDNLITGNKSNITEFFENPHFSFFELDISQASDSFASRFADVSHVFHLASPASPNKNSERSYINLPIETLLANSAGTYNLLTLAKEKNAQFLFTSTSEVYGNPSVSPQPETYFGNVNPNGIRSVYDEGKRFGEAMTLGFRRKYGLNARVVRIFNTYGQNMQKDDGRVVSNFINQALAGVSLTVYGDGSQTRSFCYIDDMIEGFMKAMMIPETDGEVINLGNPDERSISEIATIVKGMAGTSSEIVFEPLPEDDPLHRKPDITKAKRLLQWEPTVTLNEGLQKTMEYFRSA